MEPPKTIQPTTGLNVSPPTMTPTPLSPQTPPPNLSFLKPKKDPSVGKILLWIGLGLVLILLIAGTVLLLNKSSKNTPTTKTTTTITNNPSHETDNATLDQDIKDLSKSVADGDKDQTTIDSGVNDNKSQVEVPTN